MQQKWWLFAAGFVGLALAILLFPKPEGDSVPAPDMTRGDPLDFKGEERKNKPEHVRVARREAGGPEMTRVPSSRLAGMEHLTTPEAVYSGRLSGPWTLVRRQMLANGDETARAWAETVTPVVVDLRARRRDPKSVDFVELRARQDALLAEIKGNETWLQVEGVAAQVDRIEDLFTSYDETVAAKARKEAEKGKAPAPAPAPEAPAPAGGN